MHVLCQFHPHNFHNPPFLGKLWRMDLYVAVLMEDVYIPFVLFGQAGTVIMECDNPQYIG